MTGPDRPAPSDEQHPRPDEAETTVVDQDDIARSDVAATHAADSSDRPTSSWASESHEAWSRPGDAPGDADSHPRPYTPVDEDDPSESPDVQRRSATDFSAADSSAADSSAADSSAAAVHDPFRSTGQPAVAPFSSAPTQVTPAATPTRAAPTQAEPDPFARPYPEGSLPPHGSATAQPAQPSYIPPPTQQPGMTDERDTFIGQPARPDEPDLAPARSRLWQNLLGALIGLVLVFGPIIAFALLAGTPDSLFSTELSRRFLVLGLIVVAFVPALLAGWAPATAWLPGGILAVVGLIAVLSTSFAQRLVTWSTDLFGTPIVGTAVAAGAVFVGFGLLFAGLGTAWARSAGADSVVRRIVPRP